MNRILLTGAAALAMSFASFAAHAGGASGGGPVVDPGDCTVNGTCEDPGEGGEPGGDTGTGGTGGGTPSAPTPIPYTYGSGLKVFTLDSLPTGPSGTQAYWSPDQDLSNFPTVGAGGPFLPGNQGSLFETVAGTTVSFHTDALVYDPANPGASKTVIRTDDDGALFPYLSVPGVGVGILATDFGGGTAGPIYVNFTDSLSYFSINLYRLSGAFDVGSTITAYSGLDGTGAMLGTAIGSITGGNNFAYQTIELANLAGARSFTLQGTFLSNYDAITATVAPAAVPEPATWAMFIGGFGMIGGAMRRRRQTVRFA